MKNTLLVGNSLIVRKRGGCHVGDLIVKNSRQMSVKLECSTTLGICTHQMSFTIGVAPKARKRKIIKVKWVRPNVEI